MLAILLVTVPFFALVLCGWLAARQRWVPVTAIGGLNAFVLFFALPCLLFRFGLNTPIPALLNPAVLGLYLAAAAVLVFFAITITLSPRLRLKNAAFGALVAAFPNTGFMGVPLLVGLLGAAAAGPLIAVLVADMVVTTSVCLALAGLGEYRGPGRRTARHGAWRNTVMNPLPWAIALGMAGQTLGLVPLAPLDTVLRLLADAATPVALFTIGTVLWRAAQGVPLHELQAPLTSFLPTRPLGLLGDVDSGSTGLSVWPQSDEGGMAPTSPHTVIVAPTPRHAPRPQDTGTVLTLALLKLLLHPLLMLLLGASARSLGLPLSNFELTVLTLAAALPSASNVSLLAERHRADSGRVARVILVSTTLSFLTFTLLAWTLNVRPA